MDFQRIVVPYDFSDHAAAALDTALELARRFDAELHLVHIVLVPAYGYGTEILATSPLLVIEASAAARLRLDEVADSLVDPPRRVETHAVEGSQIAASIDSFAERIAADLIVMGTHGRTGLAHALIGSVAERTLRRAPCPVLTVRSTSAETQPATRPTNPDDEVPSYLL